MSSPTPDALWNAPSLRLLRPSAVSVTGLVRRPYLAGCSLTVPAGMRLLIAAEPEEAGSSLLRVLAGLSLARQGRIEIAGLGDPSRFGWGRRVAYLGPEPGIRSWMTPREAVHLAAELLGLPPRHMAARVDRVLRWARIDAAHADAPVNRGGPGLLQRTGLAAALVGDPEVLLLDEPLRAIEATERARLLSLPGSRRTMLLASRYPASEAGLVSHVCLIRGGRIVLLAGVDQLESAGLPLSMRGIAALAELRAAATQPPSRPAAAAAR